MCDEIIDIASYLEREPGRGPKPASMTLWGADGDRSRFALPLWRIVHLAQAERGVIFWRDIATGQPLHPFVVIDLARNPARLGIDANGLRACSEPTSATLHDFGPEGLLVCLGARDGRAWYLLTDGCNGREDALEARKREDVLFLAGECAGLLFLRDFAEQIEDSGDR